MGAEAILNCVLQSFFYNVNGESRLESKEERLGVDSLSRPFMAGQRPKIRNGTA